ncbi:hypothetical protein AOLI_G00176910 [Acnodon oligacanthus]
MVPKGKGTERSGGTLRGAVRFSKAGTWVSGSPQAAVITFPIGVYVFGGELLGSMVPVNASRGWPLGLFKDESIEESAGV